MPITITPIATAVATVSIGLGPGYTTVTVAKPVASAEPSYAKPLDLPPILPFKGAVRPTSVTWQGPLVPSTLPRKISGDLPAIQRYISHKISHTYSPDTTREKANYYAPLILEHSKKYNIPSILLANLIWTESNFNPREISSAGALGLGQIMPIWFHHFHTPIHTWRDPRTNLTLTCKVLNLYHTQTRKTYPRISPTNTWHRTLVAYNMGFSRVSRGTYRSRYSTFILRDLNLKTP